MSAERLELAAATEALTELFDTLVESSIKSDWLARKLFSAKIIAFEEMQRATDDLTRETEINRRQYLMTLVVKKCQEDLQKFRKFSEILDSEPAHGKYAAELRKCYESHLVQQQQMQQPPPVTSPQPAAIPPYSTAATPTQLQARSASHQPPSTKQQEPHFQASVDSTATVSGALPTPGGFVPVSSVPPEVDRSQLSAIKVKICKAVACQPAVIHHLCDELDCSGLLPLGVQQDVKYTGGKSPYEKADAMIGPVIERIHGDPRRFAPALVRALHNVGLGYVTTEASLLAAAYPYPVPQTMSRPMVQPSAGHSYSSTHTAEPAQALCVDKKEFCEMVATEIPAKWRLVGIGLGIRTVQLDAIEQNYPRDQIDCFSSVYDAWMNDPSVVPFTWEGLVQVLERNFIKERSLAVRLADSHSIDTESLMKPQALLLKDPPNLLDFLEHVASHIPAKHYWVGLALGVKDSELRSYNSRFHGDQLRCFESVFKYWESRQPGTRPFRWSSVLEALKTSMIGENALAHSLSEKMAREY